MWARRRAGGAGAYVVALKGIIADELRNERGIVRALLRVQARWERSNVHRADRVVVPSGYSASVAQTVYAVPPDRVSVVPEPLDVAEWRKRFAVAPRRASDGPMVLSVARLYPRKRIDDLLHAMALLRTRIPGVQARIVGDGPESARLRALAAALRLTDTVTFVGEVSRAALAVEYVSAHCFCLPTVQEGFGLVFAEAMAAGLAIVACRVAAVPEVVEDGRTGLLVPPGRPEELAQAMEHVLGNAEIRARLGGAGRERVEAFAPAVVARRFLEVVPR